VTATQRDNSGGVSRRTASPYQLEAAGTIESLESLGAIETLTPAERGAAITETIVPTPPVGRIHIERLILHSRNNHSGEIKLVDDVAIVSSEVEAFFTSHIGAAMLRADWRARFTEPDGEVASLCLNLLGTLEDYIEASRQLARRLFMQMRPRTIAPGDFVALTYTRDDDTAGQIALFKLDPDHRLIRTFSSRGGRLRVSISAAENLLPDSTRLQKCALLTRRTPEDDFEVTLLDTQAGPRAEGVAAFFYRGFLATELAPSARRRTREFLRCTDLWLAAHQEALTPPHMTTFYEARRIALESQFLNCPMFATQALPSYPHLHDSLLTALSILFSGKLASETSPAPGEFAIDRNVADPFVARVTLELDGGTRLIVPAARFAELVHIDSSRTSENKYRLVIESSTLKEVSDR
jgi:hypothetical protein